MSTLNPQGLTLEAIRSVPLFASLRDEAAQELATLLKNREVSRATPLFRAGDKGDAMYLIQSGRIRIAVSDACNWTVSGHRSVSADLLRSPTACVMNGATRSRWPPIIVPTASQ